MKMHLSKLKYAIIVLVALSSMTFAIKPRWDDTKSLVLNAEYGRGQTNTGYWAVVVGAETWLTKYWEIIKRFCFDNDNYDYWTYLPGFSFMVRVNSQNLAFTIYYDKSLGLDDMPFANVVKIVNALQADHDLYPALAKPAYYDWNPSSVWKWRSEFMSDRYKENFDDQLKGEPIMSNCWGNADYLTRGYKWAEGYEHFKQKGIDEGMSEFGYSFPHIYLDGPPVDPMRGAEPNQYYIDDDLLDPASSFTLMGSGDIPGGLQNTINCFDIIRMGAPPSGNNPPFNTELVWKDGTNLGTNHHCAVYLCTDRNGLPWFYEKYNNGPTEDYPYQINAFGLDADYSYENSFKCYFQHSNVKKDVNAYSYEIDWANVE